MSIYGPCGATGRQEEAGGLEESKEYTDSRVKQLRGLLLPKTGGAVSGQLSLHAISLDRRGVSISRGGNLSVNTLGGGPEIDIRQDANNTENALAGGIRLRDPSDMAFYQVGWSADGDLGVYYTTRDDPRVRVVAKFTPTHLTSLALPERPSDVATKEYVDSSGHLAVAPRGGPIQNVGTPCQPRVD
jgi:hypothetical protein